MNKRPLTLMAGLLVIAVCLSLTACASLPMFQPSDEEQIAAVMTSFKEGMETMDSTIVMPLLSDDYVGWRDTGKQEFGDFLDRMSENDDFEGMEMDIEAMEATVEGDTATVSGIVSYWGERDWAPDYKLVKEDDGWKIVGVEMNQ